MIIKRKSTGSDAQLVRLSLAFGFFLGLNSLMLPASAQVQRKPKGPPPPSFEEVMQRALNEKKAASNAPVVPPATVPPAAKISPPAVSVTTPVAPPVVIVPQSTPPVVAAPPPEVVVPAVNAVRPQPQPVVIAPPVVKVETPAPYTLPARSLGGKEKGPKFSELPPDLRPRAMPGQSAMQSVMTAPSGGAKVPNSMTNAMATLDDKYRLAIGDRLSFRIIEDQDEPKSLSVTDSGELELPLIGRYSASGKTCLELALALKARYEKEYYKKATVIVAVDSMTKSRGKVYLVGPVRAPGPQDIPSDEVLTLSKAILRAGGFSDFANKRNVKVTRKGSGGDQTFTVNVEEVLEKGQTEADLRLEPGDLIYVDERLIRF